jgi:hypothetical protein
MVKKDVLKVINEVISEFDFLGNEEYSKEQENIDLLKNEDFQKQFICDSLLNKNKLKTSVFESNVGGDWQNDSEDASKLTLEYFLKIEYKYDQNKEVIKFDLNFSSEAIDISKNDDYDSGRFGGTTDSDVAPSGSEWFNRFNWNDIEVNLNTTEGDDIDFLAFKKAPPKIKMLFIREYTESYIGTYTSMDIKTPESNVNIQNTPYC